MLLRVIEPYTRDGFTMVSIERGDYKGSFILVCSQAFVSALQEGLERFDAASSNRIIEDS